MRLGAFFATDVQHCKIGTNHREIRLGVGTAIDGLGYQNPRVDSGGLDQRSEDLKTFIIGVVVEDTAEIVRLCVCETKSVVLQD